MHQLAVFHRSDLPRLGSDATLLAQVGALLGGVALLALTIAAGRRAGTRRLLGGRVRLAVLLCAAGFAAGYLGLFAAQGVFSADRFRVAVVAPVVWAAGMSLTTWGYAVLRRRGVRHAGAVAEDSAEDPTTPVTA